MPYCNLPMHIMVPSTLESVLATFVDCPVPPYEGVTDNTYLMNTHMFLNQYLSSVYCDLGEGTLDYLILTANPAIYTSVSTLNFIKPVNCRPKAIISPTAPELTDTITSTLIRTNVEIHCDF